MRNNFADLERKSELFAQQNNRKYFSVWDINFDECTKVIDHILKIDKMLWQQHLRLDWEPPLATQPIRKEELVSYVKAMELIYGTSSYRKSEPTINTVSLPKKINHSMMTKEHHLIEQKLLRTIFRAIADNSGFLIEGKLEMLLEPYKDQG